MPEERCPVCGGTRTVSGCGCSVVFADADPGSLVRPYVPPAVSEPDVPAVQLIPPPPAAAAPVPPSVEASPPPGRATRRVVPQQRVRGRRRLRALAVGAGLLTLGVGVAFAATVRGDTRHQALPPLPANTPDTVPDQDPAPATSPAPAASGASTAPAAAKAAESPSTDAATGSGGPALPRLPLPVTPPGAPKLPVPPIAAPTPSAVARTLQLADRGPDVAAMQQLLLGCGFTHRPPSGVFDNPTRGAVERFQEAAAITIDPPGVYGPATRIALLAATPANCLLDGDR